MPLLARVSRSLPDIEQNLMRHSLRAMSDSTTACSACHRTPLCGERVFTYDDGHTLCALCRPLREDAPLTSAVVHVGEQGRAVRAA